MIIAISNADDLRLEPYRQIRERDLVGRQGLFVAEGKIVLEILLSQSDYALESVLLLESRAAQNAELLAKIPGETPVYVVPQDTMDSIAGFHVHRGILAIGRRVNIPEISELAGQQDAGCLLVVLSDISNHDNVGSIFRNAAAFSANGVILDDRCCDPLYRKALRVSVGGVLTVPWARGGSVSNIAELLANNGFEIAALSPSGMSPISLLPKSGKRALLLGSEGHGLPRLMLDRLKSYRIPMSAGFDSLNVATASGIALYAAGKYSASP